MLKIGLTGSIAVGKSFVCEILRELGCYVLDADQTARDVVRNGSVGLRQIVEHFGREVIRDDGELDRSRLASIVFSDENKRLQLNSIVHPLVFEEQERWFRAREIEDPHGIAVVDAALMIESGGHKRVEKLIVVWCQPAIQLKRLMLRDSLGKVEATRRIDSQMPQEEKKRYADFLIDTSNGQDATRTLTVEIFEQLKLLR